MAGTYNTLLTDIPAYLENEDAELTAALPTIIQAAEDRIYRDLMVPYLDTTTSIALTNASFTAAIPSDLLATRSLTYVAGGTTYRLKFRQRGYMTEYWPSTTATDAPLYYGYESGSLYRIAPTPNLTVTATLAYRAKPSYLTASSATNWVTTNAYDALLAACLAEGARFVLDDRQAGLIQQWGAEYQTRISQVNSQYAAVVRDEYNFAPSRAVGSN